MEDIAVNKSPTSIVVNSIPDTKMPSAKINILSKAYLLKLFTGRLNFPAYILGNIATATAASTISVIGVLLSISLKSMIVAAVTALAVLLIHLFFSASLTVRRMHDLNLPGYMALFLLPLYLVSYVTIFASMTKGLLDINWFALITGISMLSMYAVYFYVGQGFDLYVTFWPGTKGNNKYGKPSNHWSIEEVFCLAEPAEPGAYVPKGMSKFVKILLRLTIALAIFIVVFLAIAFGLIYLKDNIGF